MGVCVGSSRKLLTQPNLTNLSLQLEDIQISLIDEMHYIHSVILECKLEYENCIFKRNKDLALKVKLKQYFLASKMEYYQEIVKKIENSKNSLIFNVTFKYELLIEAKKILNEKKGLMLENNAKKILENDSNFISSFEN